MPEKIEVLFFSEKIRSFCSCSKLKSIIIHQGPYFSSEKPKYTNFRNKIADYKSHKIKEIKTKGKYLYFLLEGNKYYAFGVHHGMEGSWCEEQNNKHIILELIFSGNKKIFFQDSRRFGTFDLLTKEELDSKLKKIGPDVFDEIENHAKFSEIISQKPKLGNEKVCEVLVDQSFISGIGNYLRSDIMYDAKIDPSRTMNSLNEEEIKKLFLSIRKILDDVYSKKGTTTGKYTSSIHKGSYEFLVYGKKKTQKGEVIQSFKDKQKRTVWWVPSVQK